MICKQLSVDANVCQESFTLVKSPSLNIDECFCDAGVLVDDCLSESNDEIVFSGKDANLKYIGIY